MVAQLSFSSFLLKGNHRRLIGHVQSGGRTLYGTSFYISFDCYNERGSSIIRSTGTLQTRNHSSIYLIVLILQTIALYMYTRRPSTFYIHQFLPSPPPPIHVHLPSSRTTTDDVLSGFFTFYGASTFFFSRPP